MMRATSRRAAYAVVLVLVVLAGALLTAGPASAASRGFMVRNLSRTPIRVAGVRGWPHYVCVPANPVFPIVKPPIKCVPGGDYPIDFSEGRPADGSVLNPGATQSWELKYGFSIFGGIQYAAIVVYTIPGGSVEYTMFVYPTHNDSSCEVKGTSSFTCTAEGRNLTFADK